MTNIKQEKVAMQDTLQVGRVDYSILSDNQLLLKIKHDGDQRAFALLMDKYKDKVRGLSYRLLYNAEAAEDAMQDVFCTVWKNRDKWDMNGTAQFSTWIYRVTVNRCVDIKRKIKPQVDISDYELAHSDSGVDLKMGQDQIARVIRSLLDDLPVNQALALRLYYLEEKTIPEISGEMEKSELSVRSMIKRGKAGLRDHTEMLKAL